jgi:PAS domain S-box-containing protein
MGVFGLMLRYRDWRIQNKLTAATLLVVLLPMAVVSVLTLSRFTASSRDQAEANLERVVGDVMTMARMQAEMTGEVHPVPTDALRRLIAETRVGETGYPYVIELSGKLVIHPAKEGESIIDSVDSSGHYYIREIVETAPSLPAGQIGTIRYPWINPELGETKPRYKITKYAYFPEWDSIIAAGSYESEIYAASRLAAKSIALIFAITIILVSGGTIAFSRRLTEPIRRVSKAAHQMAEGDLSVRVELDQADEIGEMATAFNFMAGQTQHYTKDLENLVADKTKELRLTKEYFEAIIQSSVDMIITTDRSGSITFANKATFEILGYPADGFIGRHVSMCYVKGYQKAREIMDRLREEGSFTNFEMPLISYDGRTTPILTSAALLRDEENKVIGTVGVFTDITERKKLEAKLRRTQATLVQAGKMRALGDLVSGVAHEINNPLMASQSLVHVMKTVLSPTDANYKRVDIIAKCNRRMENIINHLREFSRADEPSFMEMDFNLPMENVLMITGQQLMNHNIRLEKELSADLPKIYGDANQLEQVFLNLIANAKDAMEDTGREKVLTIKTFAERKGGRTTLKATLTDTGAGITDEVMEKIFNPFFSTKETGKGTGLGLAITYGIIEDHHGAVDVKTRVGSGTTFIVSIPCTEDVEKLGLKKHETAVHKQAGADDEDGGYDSY